jgi:hypothetical protein
MTPGRTYELVIKTAPGERWRHGPYDWADLLYNIQALIIAGTPPTQIRAVRHLDEPWKSLLYAPSVEEHTGVSYANPDSPFGV